MAMTETRPAAESETAEATSAGTVTPAPTGGLAGLLGSGQHRTIGRLWIGTSLVYLAVVGVIGALLGVERFKTDTYNVFNKDNFAQSLSLHGVGGVFLALIPLVIGVATIVVPRQLGAETIAFPRAAAGAFWTYFVGAALVVVSYLINGGPFGGDDKGVDLFLVSLAMVAVALVLALSCLATTVLALRGPGLTLARVPAFSWSILVAATIWIASMGVLVGILVLLFVDHHAGLFQFAANTDIDNWLRWTMTQPQVYAAGIPVLGFVAEVVAVFGRTRIRTHGVVLGLIGAYGALTFGAWTFLAFDHPKLTQQFLFIAVSFAAPIVLLAFTGGMADAMRRGRPRLASPLLFGVSALIVLLGGLVSGALRAVHAFELVGTTADSAIAHASLGAAAIAMIGAVHYWWPQILTRPLRDGLGVLTALLTLVGSLALVIPDVVSGFLDEPRGSLGVVRDGVEALNVVSFLGGALLLVAVLLFVFNIAVSMGRSADGDLIDPWQGQTLEWAPDAAGVVVASPAPLLDAREGGV